MSGRVTIKSIAKDLGISHMTVSRALSDNPNVQKETRDRIVKRARELGYVKSAAAKAMRGDGSGIVGLLLPNIVNEFYARFANAMAQACEGRSLHLIIHLTNDNIAQEQVALDRLREVQATAVVMVPTPDDGGANAVDLAGMKAIQLIRQRPGLGEDNAVLVDDSAAICDAVQNLARAGHRAIGYIGGDGALSSGRIRLAAYLEGLNRAGLSELPELIQTGTPSFDMGRDRANRLLKEGHATGLICGGVEISNGALSTLMDQGVHPVRDFAFVGYGDPSFYAWVAGGITTVRLPVDDLAHAAVDLLNAGDDPETSNGVRRFDATLVVRGGACPVGTAIKDRQT